jgi:hypothetical protein
MRALVAVLVASAALLPAPVTAGPLHAEETLAEYFRLQWQPTIGADGSAIGGHVRNVSNLPVERMQLLVERLDASGAVVGQSRTWVMGVIPAHQHAYFSTRVPAAADYRVTILTFDWANCRD